MSEEQKPNTNKDPHNPVIPMTATSEYVAEVETDQEKTTTQGKPASTDDKPSNEVNTDFHKAKVKKSSSYWSNVIQIFMVAVSAAMFVVTYLLFVKTKESVDVARDSLTQFIKTDSINRVNDRVRDSLDSIQRKFEFTRDNTNISFSKKSLDAQINSIRDEQKQFELQHRAILHISNINFDTTFLKSLLPYHIDYDIGDIGTFPAMISKISEIILISSINTTKEEVSNSFLQKPIQSQELLSPKTTLRRRVSMDRMDITTYKSIMNSKAAMYFFVEIEYSSFGLNREHLYRIIYKINWGQKSKTFDFELLEITDLEK